mgnify:CR=1 FL=1
MDVQELVKGALIAGARMLENAIKDVTDEEAAQRPQGLAPIVWQVGHLAVSEAGIVKQLTGEDVSLPDTYAQIFAFGTSGEANFPPLSEVREAFARTQKALLSIADGDLARPVEGDRFYSNVAAALLFADRHRWYHIGKVMTLRGLLGKPRLLG